jgi:AcrR family transcriptional regulator
MGTWHSSTGELMLTLQTGPGKGQFFRAFWRREDAMKRKRFSEGQIAFALRQADSGTTIEEICRKMGISEPTFYR